MTFAIADQSHEAQLERERAKIFAAIERSAEEGRNPHNKALRAANLRREAERRAEYEALANPSLYAERNCDRVDHRKRETGLAQDDGSLASEGCQTLGQEEGLNPTPRANICDGIGPALAACKHDDANRRQRWADRVADDDRKESTHV